MSKKTVLVNILSSIQALFGYNNGMNFTVAASNGAINQFLLMGA
jgi:hypothetical protein